MSHIHIGKISLPLLLLGAAITVQPHVAIAQESEATQLLKAQSVALRKDMVEVGNGVYTAVSYSPANISMIVGGHRPHHCRYGNVTGACGSGSRRFSQDQPPAG